MKDRVQVNTKIGMILLLVLFAMGGMFTVNPAPHLFTELGPFELAQTLFMIASLLVWGRLAISKKQQDAPDDEINYSIAAFFALLSFVVVGRETSFLKTYGAGKSLENGLLVFTVVLALVVLSVLGVRWARNLGRTWQEFRTFMSTPNFLWAIASLAFILLGDLFEKEFLPIQSNLVWEETFELMGYLAIFTAALIPERTADTPRAVEQDVPALQNS